MKFAYADPVYLGCGRLYDAHHPEARVWDDPQTHRDLVERLSSDYPDGWVLSLSAKTLPVILPMCPEDVRVCAWVKPFAGFKKNVRVAYTWEPVIVSGGRRLVRHGAPDRFVRDHLSAPMTTRRGLTGAKPEVFCRWVLALLGWVPGDEIDDLFPGTNVMGRVAAAAELEIPYGAAEPPEPLWGKAPA